MAVMTLSHRDQKIIYPVIVFETSMGSSHFTHRSTALFVFWQGQLFNKHGNHTETHSFTWGLLKEDHPTIKWAVSPFFGSFELIWESLIQRNIPSGLFEMWVENTNYQYNRMQIIYNIFNREGRNINKTSSHWSYASYCVGNLILQISYI